MKKVLAVLLLVVILSGVSGNQAFATKDELPRLFKTTSVPIDF
ncbi:hypothetical protein [Sporosarcina sp. FSL K6-2383]